MPKDRDGSTLKESSTRPMPLPYPAVFSAGVKSDTRSHKKKLVSMQVGVFDWLYLNKPDAAPSCLRLGLPLTARQWTAVRMLEHLSFDGNTPNSVDASDMERAAGKVEGLEKSLEAVSRALASRQLWHGLASESWCSSQGTGFFRRSQCRASEVNARCHQWGTSIAATCTSTRRQTELMVPLEIPCHRPLTWRSLHGFGGGRRQL